MTTRRLLLGLVPKLCASAPFVEDAPAVRQTSLRLVLPLNPHAPPCGSLPSSHPSASSLVTAIAALEADVPAAVFFTGGTTGDPKAVPHTHSSLLWLAESLLRFYPDPFSPDVPHAGTLCFTPYFHVMGFVANFIFNLHAGCRAFILSSESSGKLSPRLMLNACAALKPSVMNTVPWIVEGLAAYRRSVQRTGVMRLEEEEEEEEDGNGGAAFDAMAMSVGPHIAGAPLVTLNM